MWSSVLGFLCIYSFPAIEYLLSHIVLVSSLHQSDEGLVIELATGYLSLLPHLSDLLFFELVTDVQEKVLDAAEDRGV